jgi:two-component system nitrate/nitrite response regulator NarL
VTRVLIVADIRLFRDGLALMLSEEHGLELAGAVANAAEAEECLLGGGVDVVVLDMANPESGVAVRRLTSAHPHMPVVALGVPEDETHVIACAEAGAAGYVPREGSVADLAAAVRGAASSELICSPRVAAGLMRRIGALSAERGPEPAARVRRLTSREEEILGLIDEGLSNKEIARRLCIELATVKNHVHNILEKLQVRRRSEAAARARRTPGRAALLYSTGEESGS